MTKRLATMITLMALFVAALAQGELVSRIEVNGAKNIPASSILAAMRTKEGQIYDPQLIARDRQSLEALGLFQEVRVFGQLLEDRTWKVVVEVVEWPMIDAIEVSGNTVFDTPRIIKLFDDVGIKPGVVLNVSLLDAASRALTALYREQGLFARITKFEPDPTVPNKLLVEIVEARVNSVIVEGNSRTKDRVFRRLMDTKPGDLLDSVKWSDDLRRIVDTRWFESIEPDSAEPELGKVDLILRVKETRTGVFNVGVQVDPRNNLAGFVSMQETNFLGTGQMIGINVLQSAQGLGTSVTLDYANPILDDKRTSLTASLYTRQTFVFGGSLFGAGGGGSLNTSDRISQRRTGASVGISRPFDRKTRASVAIRAERLNTINFTPDPGEEFIVQDGDVAALEFGVLRNRRDNSVDPASGDWLKIAIEPSYSNITSVGGLTTGYDILGAGFFTRFTVDYRKYFSAGPPRAPEEFDEPRQVIAARVYAGHIVGNVPFTEQFFVGGSNGVRGYEEDRFWGKTAFLAQLEYRHPLQKSFNIVGFVDYGGAWGGYGTVREFIQAPNLNLKLGFGVGVNFKTAFGPIRLDLGFDQNGRPRTHFQIGGTF
ncbi:MAG: BamA/TamA family outer membrane protein [Fimbriimonadales bacterium]